MDVKIIVASMTIILIILFIVTDHYRKREIALMRAEAAYYKALKEWQKNPQDPKQQEETKQKAQKYGEAAKMTEKEIEKMLEEDLSPTPAS